MRTLRRVAQRPLDVLDSSGDQLSFYLRARAWSPRAVRRYRRELLRLLAEVTPLGSVGKPEDIADVVVFLCSDAASWVTGQVLAADGGQLTTVAVLRRIQEGVRRQIGQPSTVG